MNIVPTKLKTGDEVVVVTGKDKGKKGTEKEEFLCTHLEQISIMVLPKH